MPANLKTLSLTCLLEPIAHLIDPYTADLKTTRYLRRSVPSIQGPQNPVTQILRVSLHPHPLLRRQMQYLTYVYT